MFPNHSFLNWQGRGKPLILALMPAKKKASPKAKSSRLITASKDLVADVALANLILFDHEIVDGFGHVSARHDKDPERFVMARYVAPGIVTPDDIREFGLVAFSFEVLESFEPSPELTATKIREELAVLEALWREKLDPTLLY